MVGKGGPLGSTNPEPNSEKNMLLSITIFKPLKPTPDLRPGLMFALPKRQAAVCKTEASSCAFSVERSCCLSL